MQNRDSSFHDIFTYFAQICLLQILFHLYISVKNNQEIYVKKEFSTCGPG